MGNINSYETSYIENFDFTFWLYKKEVLGLDFLREIDSLLLYGFLLDIYITLV